MNTRVGLAGRRYRIMRPSTRRVSSFGPFDALSQEGSRSTCSRTRPASIAPKSDQSTGCVQRVVCLCLVVLVGLDCATVLCTLCMYDVQLVDETSSCHVRCRPHDYIGHC